LEVRVDLVDVVAVAVLQALAADVDRPMSRYDLCLVVPGVVVEWVCHTGQTAVQEGVGQALDDEDLA
jgi:hypothetical protein